MFHDNEASIHPSVIWEVNVFRLFVIVIALLMTAAACAQTANQTPQQAPPQLPAEGATQAPAQLPAGGTIQSPPPLDSARQMRLDLDQMESLVNNMAAQVSFIRDTNMSILLNTNVRLWSVLIRDLRMELQEQERGKRPSSPQR
jgi:hypothetical protein